jgi:O-phospho-L-seryl-tRNASec:L-selenocysteinyl-tRNA synthase
MSDSIKELQKTISSSLSIPTNHLTLGLTNLIHSNKSLLSLITHRRLPEHGWSDIQIQSLLYAFSSLDTNHESSLTTSTTSSKASQFHGRWVGVGEREGRVYSTIVMNRHYGLSHGIGRSGDVTEPQPKAVGSSIMAQLTTSLVLDVMRRGSGLKGDKSDGMDPAKFGLVLPMCTGMSMALILSSLTELSTIQAKNEQKKDIVLWSRIDQKSCFKAIRSAGFQCIVVPTTKATTTDDDSVITDITNLQQYMIQYKDRLVAVISTTSCFAPRVPDKIDDIGKLCKEMNVPHVINNAYGLQCQTTCKLINRACVVGRVDAIVCSTDKNFLVPVGEYYYYYYFSSSQYF